MTKYYDLVAEKYPERVEIARSWGKSRPHVTVGAYLFMDRERRVTDRMLAAIGNDNFVSIEADGVVPMKRAGDVAPKITAAAGTPIAEKLYPQNFAEWVAFAKKRHPELMWTKCSRIAWREFQASYRNTLKAVTRTTWCCSQVLKSSSPCAGAV